MQDVTQLSCQGRCGLCDSASDDPHGSNRWRPGHDTQPAEGDGVEARRSRAWRRREAGIGRGVRRFMMNLTTLAVVLSFSLVAAEPQPVSNSSAPVQVDEGGSLPAGAGVVGGAAAAGTAGALAGAAIGGIVGTAVGAVGGGLTLALWTLSAGVGDGVLVVPLAAVAGGLGAIAGGGVGLGLGAVGGGVGGGLLGALVGAAGGSVLEDSASE